MTSLLLNGANESAATLGVQSLEDLLRTVEPGVVLVPPWLMQNVAGSGQKVHRSSLGVYDCQIYAIKQQRLVRMAVEQALAIPGELPVVETIVLVARPENEWLAARPRGQVLRHYWRLLFHYRVAAEVRRKLPAPPADRVAVETRIERLGRSVFCEAQFVLQREQCLPHGADTIDAYVEFAALYLELHRFRPDMLPAYFPAVDNVGEVLATLTSDVDADELLRRSRVPGADEPQSGVSFSDDGPMAAPVQGDDTLPAGAAIAPLLAMADHAASVGNIVRAAILKARTTAPAPGELISAVASADLDVLVNRLTAALELNEVAAEMWRSSLSHVLALAGDSWWNQEARLLYDLQKACVDHEREIYSVGVVEWLKERGRRPLRRPQPNQRIALMCKALRSALRRIHRARLAAAHREILSHLLHDALHHAEQRLCDALRPAVTQSLKAGNLVPRNAAERVAEDKVVEELLDGLTHRGFITLSNVRDAIATNQLKFNDIPNPVAYLAGDPLFRIDRQLSISLDGVYHRGEVYLRLFQRASSLLFATMIGRFLTRVFLMPLLGSYIILAGIDHTLFALGRLATHWLTHTYDPATYTGHRSAELAAELAKVVAAGQKPWHLLHLEPLLNFGHHEHPHNYGEVIAGNVTFAFLAVILLGVVNWAACRRVVRSVLAELGHGIGMVFYRAPKWLIELPAVQAVVNSRAARLLVRFVLEPLALAGAAWLLAWKHADQRTQWTLFGAVFVLANFLLNNPVGRAVEQTFFHWLRTSWARVTTDVIANVFTGVLHFFGRRLEDFDRMIYAVDEWLRFREGQGQSSLYLKAVLGIFWFYIAYISRFVVNLLVEPQINPIKHFPVVTVSHKIILPQAHMIQTALVSYGVQKGRAAAFAGGIVMTIPGIFGFLAWELRANWSLYRANRKKLLRPVMVGSHGESMAHLLRPGFHSGTIPKMFGRLRKALRESDEHNDPVAGQVALLKHEEAIEHTSQAVAHFVERELLALLNQHPVWQETPVSLNGVKLYATRVTVELICPAHAATMRIFFEQRGGWILAGTEKTAGGGKVSEDQAQYLAAGLLGLYKMAGVDIVKEQVEHAFDPQPVAFDLTNDAMTVWPDRKFDHPLVFNLRKAATSQAEKVDVQKLLFRPVSIEWDQWVRIWEPSENGAAVFPATFTSTCVLPRRAGPNAALQAV